MNDEYTYEEAAEVLGVARNTVCMAVSKGVLHSVRHRGSNRKFLSKKEVDAKIGKPLITTAAVMSTGRYDIQTPVSGDQGLQLIRDVFVGIADKLGHHVQEAAGILGNQAKEAIIDYLGSGKRYELLKNMEETVNRGEVYSNHQEFAENIAQTVNEATHHMTGVDFNLTGNDAMEHYNLMVKHQQENQKGEYL